MVTDLERFRLRTRRPFEYGQKVSRHRVGTSPVCFLASAEVEVEMDRTKTTWRSEVKTDSQSCLRLYSFV